jgi:ABC-type nitrate/sulfonate/bicarbonate transport system permease component
MRHTAMLKIAKIAKSFAGAMTGLLVRSYPLILVLLAWDIAARSGMARPIFLPTVSAVVQQFWILLHNGEVILPLLVSIFRAFAGLFLAVVFGAFAGLLMARSKVAHWALDPLVSFTFPAPKVAFMPIFILWFGIDHLSKILLVAFTCIFPMIVASYHGATAVSRIVIWSAEAMGTPERKILYRIILPATLPYIFSGMRVTLPVALIIAFTAEMIEGGGGLGAALMYAQRFFLTPTVFVYIVVMLMAGFVFDWLMRQLRGRLIAWDDETQNV